MSSAVDEFAQFQSTLPVRGATESIQQTFGGVRFQSTLPVRGATKSNYMGDTLMSYISIHAPREGSDENPTLIKEESKNFNPRSP